MNVEQFWQRVRKSDGCWVWMRNRTVDGYGQFGEQGGKKSIRAHRRSWESANGPIPPGMLVLHRCDNPPCVRPSHLFLGTAADNNRDCILKGRKRYATGEACGAAVLSAEQVLAIRRCYLTLPFTANKRGRVGTMELAEEFGISRSNLQLIVASKTWCSLVEAA